MKHMPLIAELTGDAVTAADMFAHALAIKQAAQANAKAAA